MIQTQPLDLGDFSGGLTDTYVDAPISKSKKIENLVVTYDRKLLTRPGSIIYNSTYYQIPAGAQRIGNLINFDNDSNLLHQSSKKVYTILGGGWSTLQGPTANDVFPTATTSSLISHGQWNKHLFLTSSDYDPVTKIYKDAGGTFKVRTAGMPYLANAPTCTPAGAGAANYLYAFHYHYAYNASSNSFEDFGPTELVEVNNSVVVAAGAPNTIAITNIPVIANGVTLNYDTTVIKVYIFRTQNGGSVFYKVGEVTNGTTTFNDNSTDATISNNELLYTTGGVLDNDPPPLCKLLHVAGNFAYYANIKDGSDYIRYRMFQSVAGDLDSVPIDFFVDIDQEITGLSSVGGNPILITPRGVYRVDGKFDELGLGGMVPSKIDDTADCVAQNSIVQIPGGIVWLGSGGVYHSDGYNVNKISQDLKTTYAAFVSSSTKKNRITGVYDPTDRRVKWTVTDDDASTDNDTVLVLDLRWGMSETASFQTWTGGESFRPTSLVYFSGSLLRGDSRGYTFKHSHDYLSDPRVNVLTNPSTWQKDTIIYDWTSVALDFGSKFLRKWVPRVVITLANKSNVSVQVRSINDDSRKVKNLAEIRFRGNLVWGDPNINWGDPDIIWAYEGLIEEQRRFPAGSLRCSYKQVQVTNSLSNVTNSDFLGEATVDTTANTATLDEYTGLPDSVIWPEDAIDYYILFENDNYVKEYPIIARTDSIITFIDATDTIPNGTYKWLIKGYPKDEAINLLNVTIHYGYLSKTQNMFHGETGAVET